MQVRAGGIAGAAAVADGLAAIDALAALDVDGAQVGVEGLVAVAMVNHDHVAIAAADPTGVDDNATVSSEDAIAKTYANVNGKVT